MVNDFWGQQQTTQQAPSQPQQAPQQDQLQGASATSQFSWGNQQTPFAYQAQQEEETPSLASDVLRNIVGASLKFVGGIGAVPGEAGKLVKESVKSNPFATFGPVGWAAKQLLGEENWNNLAEQIPTLPGFEAVDTGIDALTGGYTKPRGKKEASLQEFAKDAGMVLGTGGRGVFNVFGVPLASNTAKGIAKELGFSENVQDTAKALTWLPLGLWGNVSAPRYASGLMNQARNGIPQNLQFDVNRLDDALNRLEQSPMFRLSDPRSQLARQTINNLRQEMGYQHPTVRGLMNSYDGVNATARSRGMFELGRGEREYARQRLNDVRRAVANEIEQSASQYPEAMQNWQNGRQAWATIHDSNYISNYVSDLLADNKIPMGKAAVLFTGAPTVGGALYSAPAITGALGGTGAAAYQSGKVISRMIQSPTLANYYYNAILGAQRNNLPMFLDNYKKLNAGLNKKEKKS